MTASAQVVDRPRRHSAASILTKLIPPSEIEHQITFGFAVFGFAVPSVLAGFVFLGLSIFTAKNRAAPYPIWGFVRILYDKQIYSVARVAVPDRAFTVVNLQPYRPLYVPRSRLPTSDSLVVVRPWSGGMGDGRGRAMDGQEGGGTMKAAEIVLLPLTLQNQNTPKRVGHQTVVARFITLNFGAGSGYLYYKCIKNIVLHQRKGEQGHNLDRQTSDVLTPEGGVRGCNRLRHALRLMLSRDESLRSRLMRLVFQPNLVS